jgi:hypothetical protein
MKHFFAILLVMTMVLCGCAKPDNAIYESAEGSFNTQVDEKQILLERSPANNETVTLVNEEVTKFLKGYAMGKGLSVANTRQQDASASVPVTLSWVCDKESTGYTVIYTTKQDFSDAVKIDTAEPTVQLEDLFVGTTYYWQVVTHAEKQDYYSTVFCFKTAETPRLIYMKGVDNARDVGGYMTVDGQHKVAQGMIYRGARLNDITEEGIEKARDVYKIKTDLDLRRKTDNGYSDVTPLQNAQYINISVIDYNGAYSYPDEMRDAIALCAKRESYPIYVHCSAGRDRTGTMLFIIGALLGVPEEDLCADFELTYLTRRSYANGDLTGHNSFLSFLEKFKAYEGTTLQEKAESYCKSIGVTDEQIQSIRSILLEEIK